MTITITILTVGGSLAGYFAVEKWLIPQIIRLIKYVSERKHKKDLTTLDVNKELIEVKEVNNNLYENQINFFVGQIDTLQKQLLRKSDEINEMNIQLDEMRIELLIIKKQLFEEKKINNELTGFYCQNMNCPNRIKK